MTKKTSGKLCRHTRIVGGTPANIKDHPYQISLQHVYSGHFCGGSILNKYWIVTAAHCLIGRSTANCGVLKEANINAIQVRAGSSYKHEGGTVRKVYEMTIHPRYQNFDYDVALVKVKSPFHFNDRIKPISMASTPPAVGTCVVVSGWGLLYQGGYSPAQLQHVEVDIKDIHRCASTYYGLTPRMICAGWSAGGKGVCQMDSGGPLVSGSELVGIVSWGYGCAVAGYPGVYVNVPAVRKWIKAHIAYL
ncbi:trypsin beta-like [Periplaneta americana]|uniref:trypsin beta-like n=1 Tax=Periplaneta americana TaxID=6978 RepID=UPI0037E71A68